MFVTFFGLFLQPIMCLASILYCSRKKQPAPPLSATTSQLKFNNIISEVEKQSPRPHKSETDVEFGKELDIEPVEEEKKKSASKVEKLDDKKGDKIHSSNDKKTSENERKKSENERKRSENDKKKSDDSKKKSDDSKKVSKKEVKNAQNKAGDVKQSRKERQESVKVSRKDAGGGLSKSTKKLSREKLDPTQDSG